MTLWEFVQGCALALRFLLELCLLAAVGYWGFHVGGGTPADRLYRLTFNTHNKRSTYSHYVLAPHIAAAIDCYAATTSGQYPPPEPPVSVELLSDAPYVVPDDDRLCVYQIEYSQAGDGVTCYGLGSRATAVLAGLKKDRGIDVAAVTAVRLLAGSVVR